MLPLFDMSTETGRSGLDDRLRALRATVAGDSQAAATVAQILAEVRAEGDAALVRYMQKWTDPQFAADHIRVTSDELAGAHKQVDPELLGAIDAAIEHVREYQMHIRPADVDPVTIAGAELGLRYTPVQSAGLTVPGGTAILFSTLIMLAVPAMVAGVPAENIAVVNPPPTRRGDEAAGDLSPIVLATAHRLGLTNIYRLGGAQAVAALAFGSESVKPVQFIAGPGNVFVQLAKSQVHGIVGTEGGFYGPSEIVTIADESANPQRVAADLIAQAEHDPGKCFLISWSKNTLDRIEAAVREQLPQRKRREAIEKALANESAAVLVENQEQAVELANTFAAEHVNLAVAEPDAVLEKLRHAGEVFLGDATPVAAGDYWAGPSHTLPTGCTARFASGVSCHTFLKRTGTVAYRSGLPREAIEGIARMAEAEGLDGHAHSVRIRGEDQSRAL